MVGRAGLTTVARAGTVGIAVLAATTLSACGGSSAATDVQTVTSSNATTSAPTSAAPTTSAPVALTPTETAQHAAIAIVRKYFTTIDQLYSNPKSAFSLIYTTTTGAQADIDRANVSSDRVKQVHQTGRQTIASISAGAVNLTNKPKNKPNPIFPTVTVTSCNDVSKVNFLNTKGRSTVVAGRKNFLVNTITVVNIAYPAAGSWRVSTITNKEASACPQ